MLLFLLSLIKKHGIELSEEELQTIFEYIKKQEQKNEKIELFFEEQSELNEAKKGDNYITPIPVQRQ